MPSGRRLALALVLALAPSGVSAQDVEMLGRRHGTRPPDGYYRELARDPGAFRFTRGRSARLRQAIEQGGQDALRGLGGPGAIGGPQRAFGPRTEPVVGDVSVPVVLALFSESPGAPYAAATVAGAYFGPGATVSAYYAEVSSDSITLDGDVLDWVRSTRSEAETTEGESGLVCCGIGDFVEDVVSMLPGVDWGLYDNDGPDGVPNSGDDDGYVDALAVMHPRAGAECDGSQDRIWSHKWTLSSASSDLAAYATSAPSANGGFIQVDDYFVQGALDCDGVALNPIGVFAHETGHAFGLPDLYDTREFGAHAGAGYWDLMASGTYGCSGGDPARPCHMGAWSKAVLGWVDVTVLPPDTDFGALTLPPVETTGAVFRVDAQDGSGEYFLLENRQRLGFDGTAAPPSGLLAEGLLVWQIDQDEVLARWASNTVNSFDQMGVWLRQADGRDDLGQSGAGDGDSGDPFPGLLGNSDFDAGSNPAARSHEGTAVGLALHDIALSGEDVTFEAVTGFAVLAVSPLDIELIATVPQDVQLTVLDGGGAVVWNHVGGALPEGLTLSTDGRLTGAAIDLGTFPVAVEAVDGNGLSGSATLTLAVSAPTIPIEELASEFVLGGPALTEVEEAFLDRQGNDDGAYDLGDFRAWVLANPGLPLAADVTRREDDR